jgi:hypothetical protein
VTRASSSAAKRRASTGDDDGAIAGKKMGVVEVYTECMWAMVVVRIQVAVETV